MDNIKIIDVSKKRGEHEIVLTEQYARVRIVGIFETHKDDLLEFNLRVVHRAQHIHTEVELRAVVWDSSQIHLSGTVVIEKSAVHADAVLHERILLMSPTAKATAQPYLEIHTDNVKCSHASVISCVDKEQLLYAMSRGVPVEQANKMIAEGILIASNKS